jgi:hypothetical protein
MEVFGGVLTAFLVAALPLGVTVTKVVDFVRNLLGAAEPNVPKWVWSALALVVIALSFEINLIDPIAAAIPGLNGWSPSSTAAEIVTGLAIGAMGSFWHEKLSAWSAQS